MNNEELLRTARHACILGSEDYEDLVLRVALAENIEVHEAYRLIEEG